jgi:hypothetical protein
LARKGGINSIKKRLAVRAAAWKRGAVGRRCLTMWHAL